MINSIRSNSPNTKIAIAIVVMLFIFPGCGLPKSGTNESLDPYYFADGKKIPLIPSNRLIAVRFKPGHTFHLSSAFPSLIVPNIKRELIKNRLTLFNIKQNVGRDKILNMRYDLQENKNIDLVAQVFDNGKSAMIVTDEFIAQFQPEISDDLISKLNQKMNVEVIEKVTWSENTYRLRTRTGDALNTSNTYHEFDDVLYAQPNFIRILSR